MSEYYGQVYDVPTLLEEPLVSMTLEENKEDGAFLQTNDSTKQRPCHHRQLDDLCEAITTREIQEKSQSFHRRHSRSTLFRCDNEAATANENRPPAIPGPRPFKLSSQATTMADVHQNDKSATQLLSDFWGSSGSIHSVSRVADTSSPPSLLGRRWMSGERPHANAVHPGNPSFEKTVHDGPTECDIHDVDNETTLSEHRFTSENHYMASISKKEQTNRRKFVAAEGAHPCGLVRTAPSNPSFQYPQPGLRPQFYAHGPFVDPRSNQADAHPIQQLHATAVHPPMVVQTDFGPAVLLYRTGAPSIPLTTKPVQCADIPHEHGQFNSRSASSVKNNHHQSDSSPQDKTAMAPETKGKSTRFHRWSEEEDEILLQAAKQEPGPPYNWNRIATKYFPVTRTGPQCKARWKKALKPGLKRGQWEPEEDRLILELVEKGLKWTEIAEQIPGRVPDHIHQRFMNTLDPTKKKTPWSENENNVLYEAQKKFGNKWSQISKLLPGRSDNDVKNRWHNAKMAQRRKMRRLAKEHDRLSLIIKDIPTTPDTGSKKLSPL